MVVMPIIFCIKTLEALERTAPYRKYNYLKSRDFKDKKDIDLDFVIYTTWEAILFRK